MATGHLTERCIIVYRDQGGYGLTVGGDNPACIQSVKEDGAAKKAGACPGDKILKVNGTPVVDSKHMDVVHMISSSNEYVALTLCGRSQSLQLDRRRSRGDALLSRTPTRQSSAGHILEKVVLNQRFAEITTVESDDLHKNYEDFKPFEAKSRRWTTLEHMYEDEVKNIKDLEARLRGSYCSGTELLLTQAKRRLKNLANQFSELKMAAQQQQHQRQHSESAKPAFTKQQKSIIHNNPSLSRSFDSPLRENQQRRGVKLDESSITKQNSSSDHQIQRLNPKNQNLALCQPQPTAQASRAYPNSLHFVSTAQVNVMEEDSDSDTESVVPLETEGPFSNFAELKNRPAHLAVFLHYLLSNCDPSSLLFFLITDFYSSGSSKDMRKWAYEIHSTFLTPTAPLRVCSIDMPVVHEIDAILYSLLTNSGALSASSSSDIDHDEVMRRIFVKARQKALDEINDLMADFRNKRMLGLGNVYGENKLNGLVPGDTNRERKIVDTLLTQHFENFYNGKSDFDQLTDRQQALAASLATIVKHMGVKPNSMFHEKLLEKCPSFVAKERKSFNLLAKPTKKPTQVKGHYFQLAPILMTTICYQCQECIWGINPQGYFCSNCDVVVHKCCAGSLEDTCCGPPNRSAVAGAKIAPSRSHVRNRPYQHLSSSSATTTPTHSLPLTFMSPTPAALSPRGGDDAAAASMTSPRASSYFKTAMATTGSSSAPMMTSSATPPSVQYDGCSMNVASHSVDDMYAAEDEDKTTDLPLGSSGSPGRDAWASTSVSADSGYGGDVIGDKSNNSVVGRSQSMKSHQEEQRLLKRNGDSGRRTKSDVDTDDKSIAIAMGGDQRVQKSYSSTSSSSMSRASLPESPPSTDAENTLSSHPSKPSIDSNTSTLTVTSSCTTSTLVLRDSQKIVEDSDLEADNEIPHLEDFLDWETIKMLKPKERKRQEVVNELFHTERTHVRNIKILYHVFYEPMLASNLLSFDTLKIIFPNAEEILELHSKLNTSMKLMSKQSKLIGDIGTMLLSFFDGQSGERFKSAVATFCQNQQHALEVLKIRQKKDPKFLQFLQEAESSVICRKLQLKDMLPMEMQRLTKYPLLLETIAKHTHGNPGFSVAEPSEEFDNLKRCVEKSKRILDAVNTAKRISENNRRLDELQRRLDTKEFDRMSHPVTKLYKSLDLRVKNLVHDGPLTWRLAKNKVVDLHVVLMEDMLILLTRNSDGHKLSLKFHNVNLVSSKEDIKFTHCPLLKLSGMIAKNVATDKKAFFIVSTPAQGPQIYELVAQTASEKKHWFKLITEQIDSCKQKENVSTGQNVTPVSALSQKLDVPITANPPSTPTAQQADTSAENKMIPSPADASHVADLLAIERIEVVSQPGLINPCEVRICQPTVLEHAEPVLTPYERLKRKDDLIIKSLTEKHKIISQTFGLPDNHLERLAETFMDAKNNRDAKEMALAAVVQTNRILEAINGALKMSRSQSEEFRPASSSDQSEGSSTPTAIDHLPPSGSPRLSCKLATPPSVPCATLTCIVAPLMKNLTGLLHSLQTMEEDLKRVQNELRLCKMSVVKGGENSSAGNKPIVGQEIINDRCETTGLNAIKRGFAEETCQSVGQSSPKNEGWPKVETASVIKGSGDARLSRLHEASKMSVNSLDSSKTAAKDKLRPGSSSVEPPIFHYADDVAARRKRIQSASPQPPLVAKPNLGGNFPAAEFGPIRSSGSESVTVAGPTAQESCNANSFHIPKVSPKPPMAISLTTTKPDQPIKHQTDEFNVVDVSPLSSKNRDKANDRTVRNRNVDTSQSKVDSDNNDWSAEQRSEYIAKAVACESSASDDGAVVAASKIAEARDRRRQSVASDAGGDSPLSSPLDGDRSFTDDRRREKLKQKRQRNAALGKSTTSSPSALANEDSISNE